MVGAGGYTLYRWYNKVLPEADDIDGGEEDPETKRRRYQSLRLEEASEPDDWMQVHHFDGDDPENEDEADVQVDTTMVSFETLSGNVEVALLMTLQKFLGEIHSYGQIAAWTAVWQLKQLLKVCILQTRPDLVYNGLKSLKGSVTSSLDEEVWRAIYEPRISYKEDFGDLARVLCQRYFVVHGFEGEDLYHDVLVVIRDLDLAALEEAQLQRGRDNDPTTRLELDLQRARESAMRTLENEIELALENNDMERAHQRGAICSPLCDLMYWWYLQYWLFYA